MSVHVNDHEVFLKMILEYVVHHCLKSGWGIAHAEEHYFWFIESKLGLESTFH